MNDIKTTQTSPDTLVTSPIGDAQDLSFDRGSVAEVIDQSAYLLETLVPGTCRREPVKAFCEQAPIARYMEAAAGSSEWDDKSRRKFVREHRNGKIPSSLILQLAYCACIDERLTATGIHNVLEAVGNKEHNYRCCIQRYPDQGTRDLVTGNFGTLRNSEKQSELRQDEVDRLNWEKLYFDRLTHDRNSPISTTVLFDDNHLLVPQAQSWYEGNRPNRIEIRDQCRNRFLTEFARHVILRHPALVMDENKCLEIWGVTHMDIINATARHQTETLNECALFGVDHSTSPAPLSEWEGNDWSS